MERKNFRLFLSLLILASVIFIGANVQRTDQGFLFDKPVMDAIYSVRTVAGLKFMKLVTFMGSKYFFLIALLGLGYYYIARMERERAWMLVSSIVGSYGLNAILKLIFARSRPIMYMAVEKSGYSFPSGHSMVSMSFYTSMTYILLKGVENKAYKVLAYIFNFFLIAMIGYSRLYLGVHWPTDILAGYLMGFLVFFLSKEKFLKGEISDEKN